MSNILSGYGVIVILKVHDELQISMFKVISFILLNYIDLCFQELWFLNIPKASPVLLPLGVGLQVLLSIVSFHPCPIFYPLKDSAFREPVVSCVDRLNPGDPREDWFPWRTGSPSLHEPLRSLLKFGAVLKRLLRICTQSIVKNK